MKPSNKSFGLTCSCGKAGVWLYRGQPYCGVTCLMEEIMKHLTEISRTTPRSLRGFGVTVPGGPEAGGFWRQTRREDPIA